jgi:hypothetical protein
LKEAELIRCERRAQEQVYSLDTSVFEDVASMLLDLFQKPVLRKTCMTALRRYWLAILFAASAVVGLCHGRLPERIPVHWNLHGGADGWMTQRWVHLRCR